MIIMIITTTSISPVQIPYKREKEKQKLWALYQEIEGLGSGFISDHFSSGVGASLVVVIRWRKLMMKYSFRDGVTGTQKLRYSLQSIQNHQNSFFKAWSGAEYCHTCSYCCSEFCVSNSCLPCSFSFIFPRSSSNVEWRVTLKSGSAFTDDLVKYGCVRCSPCPFHFFFFFYLTKGDRRTSSLPFVAEGLVREVPGRSPPPVP